ncbi:hypothetical protein PMI24_04414 [Pseudomonas sp. GM25]|nr:hypothetical protein PMI24_04414 [Pseudomonas sp. GM25]
MVSDHLCHFWTECVGATNASASPAKAFVKIYRSCNASARARMIGLSK